MPPKGWGRGRERGQSVTQCTVNSSAVYYWIHCSLSRSFYRSPCRSQSLSGWTHHQYRDVWSYRIVAHWSQGNFSLQPPPPKKNSNNLRNDFLFRCFRDTGGCAGAVRTVLPSGSEPGVPVWSKPRPTHVLQTRGRRRRLRRPVHSWGWGRQEPGWVSTSLCFVQPPWWWVYPWGWGHQELGWVSISLCYVQPPWWWVHP